MDKFKATDISHMLSDKRNERISIPHRAMTRDEIIAMAQEAIALHSNENPFDFRLTTLEQLECFAALVTEAEIEKMISDGWRQCAERQSTTQYCGLLEDAVKAEREACAEVSKRHSKRDDDMGAIIAAAIRARGNK